MDIPLEMPFHSASQPFGTCIAKGWDKTGSTMTSSEMTQDVKRRTTASPTVERQVDVPLARLAECECPILIEGEHGVGKRYAAAHIHALSHRSRGMFNEVRCDDLDAPALLSALSTNGTVHFLEVSELTVDFQELILDSCLRSDQPKSSRLLFSSSRELLEEVKALRMREDFYYFISAVTLRIPPLRCRKADILPIAESLLAQYSKQFDRPEPELSDEVREFLMRHTWPDNLSELQTAIKTFVAIGDQAISFAALKAAAPSRRFNGNRTHLTLKQASRAASTRVERQLISEVLVSAGGNRKRAADQLGISYKALLYKLKQIESAVQPRTHSGGVVL